MKLDKDILRLLFFKTLGNFMVIMSLFMIGKTFLPALGAEINYYFRQVKQVKTKVIAEKPVQSPATTSNPFSSLLDKFTQTEELISPVSTDFGIVIPRINANSAIIPSVDTNSYEEYIESLKIGVAHAKGTALPGDNGHIYLFAHSTDNVLSVGTYNAVFYLLYKLEPKDKIYLFYQGKKHVYSVLSKKIINPTEVHYLTRSSASEFLTLQTCWPPGTTLKRLLVFATPVVK